MQENEQRGEGVILITPMNPAFRSCDHSITAASRRVYDPGTCVL